MLSFSIGDDLKFPTNMLARRKGCENAITNHNAAGRRLDELEDQVIGARVRLQVLAGMGGGLGDLVARSANGGRDGGLLLRGGLGGHG